MLYVQQSLTPNEEILKEARFHWMYTMHAVMWIIFGAGIGVSLGYAAIWWDVTTVIRNYYPDLPDEMFRQAWNMVVAEKGGYLRILWEQNPILRFGILGSFVMGIFFFLHMMIIKATTEIAVTNERLIYKKGLIARDVGELSIDKIEGVSVHQTMFGRIFDYGRISARGMGVGEVLLPTIDNPIGFRRAIDEARDLREREVRDSKAENAKTKADDF